MMNVVRRPVHCHRFISLGTAAIHSGATVRALTYRMGKNKKFLLPSEEHLELPLRPLGRKIVPIVDTHTHLISTFAAYRGKYKKGKYETVFDFVRGLYQDRHVEAIVDVWCEAPVQTKWKEIADSALTEESRREKWSGLEYWFVMGT